MCALAPFGAFRAHLWLDPLRCVVDLLLRLSLLLHHLLGAAPEDAQAVRVPLLRLLLLVMMLEAIEGHCGWFALRCLRRTIRRRA